MCFSKPLDKRLLGASVSRFEFFRPCVTAQIIQSGLVMCPFESLHSPQSSIKGQQNLILHNPGNKWWTWYIVSPQGTKSLLLSCIFMQGQKRRIVTLSKWKKHFLRMSHSYTWSDNFYNLIGSCPCLCDLIYRRAACVECSPCAWLGLIH